MADGAQSSTEPFSNHSAPLVLCLSFQDCRTLTNTVGQTTPVKGSAPSKAVSYSPSAKDKDSELAKLRQENNALTQALERMRVRRSTACLIGSSQGIRTDPSLLPGQRESDRTRSRKHEGSTMMAAMVSFCSNHAFCSGVQASCDSLSPSIRGYTGNNYTGGFRFNLARPTYAARRSRSWRHRGYSFRVAGHRVPV